MLPPILRSLALPPPFSYHSQQQYCILYPHIPLNLHYSVLISFPLRQFLFLSSSYTSPVPIPLQFLCLLLNFLQRHFLIIVFLFPPLWLLYLLLPISSFSPSLILPFSITSSYLFPLFFSWPPYITLKIILNISFFLICTFTHQLLSFVSSSFSIPYIEKVH